MALTYQALLSPLKINGMVVRNRMGSSASTPHFLQGRENYATEKFITHFANRAKNGASIIHINHLHMDEMPFPGRTIDNPPGHFNAMDMDDATAQNYLCQLIDAIHFYGSKACGYIMPGTADMGVMPPPPPPMPGMPGLEDMPKPEELGRDKEAQEDRPPAFPLDDITEEMMDAYVASIVQQAKDLKALGFDMVSLYSCYRNAPHSGMLSPLKNHRTDEYGGCLENRAKLLIRIFTELRRALGRNYPLEVVLSVCEPEGGYTVDDTVRLAEMTQGLIDVFHLRSGDMDPQHPLGYTSREDKPMPFIDEMAYVCKRVHALGLKTIVAASSGFQNIPLANDAIVEGKADYIYMARAWINNPEYGKLVFEGRPEEMVPCVRCNKCHVPNGRDMWRTVCTVNPVVGLEDKLCRMIAAPEQKLKVAVVGGGPAGMEFARICAERGHDVTLYEATDRLGGQLKHADYPSFKWPLRQFKDWMADRMDRLGVKVVLNTKATPALIAAEGYDAVGVAMGSTPTAPPLPGIDGPNVQYASQIYGGKEEALSDNVVLIGGGEIGVETALYLCELGKKVTVLEMLPELIMDAPHAHYKNMVMNYWRHEPNFSSRCGVTVTAIDPDGVRYRTRTGAEEKILCGDVLLSIGSRPLQDEAMAFYAAAPRCFMLGDCDSVANVQKAMRTAFAAASTL